MCGIADMPHLTNTGIGALRIGASVDAVRESCRIFADTSEFDAEGMQQRVLLVNVGGEEVRGLVHDDRIWRIEVGTDAFTTTDSLGVGVTLATLLASKRVTGIEGDGLLYVLADEHCGLSFRLSYVPGDREHRSTWTELDLERIPPQTRVDQVLVTGCQPADEH